MANVPAFTSGVEGGPKGRLRSPSGATPCWTSGGSAG